VASSLYPISLSAGMWVRLKADANKPSVSASPVSFHLNGLSANIRAGGEDTLWPGAITSGQVHELVYDGSAWQLQNPGSVWVKRSFAAFKGRIKTGAEATVDPGALGLITCSVEMRRFFNDAEVRMESASGKVPTGDAGAFYATETTADGLYLSTLPGWMRPESRRLAGGITVMASVAGTQVETVAFVSTDGKLMAGKNATANAQFGLVGRVLPFTIVYRLKD
jgi:hypothetical protein